MSKPIFSQHKSKKPKIIYSVLAILIVLGLLFYLYDSGTIDFDPGSAPATPTVPEKDVQLEIVEEVLLTGLENPWDIAFLPDGTMLFTERSGRLSAFANEQKQLIGNVENVDARGEGGLMGIAVDSNFEDNNYIYLCHNSRVRGTRDVRVIRYEYSQESLSLDNAQEIVTGIQASSNGNHSGCRIRFTDEEHLWITTGDAKDHSTPQDPENLAGKILRVDRDGESVSGNATGEFDPRIFSYGHRNVQGIALFEEPIDGIFGVSTEHGPDIDDEVNPLSRGNFGWDPKPGYNEDVPMTDKEKFPNAIDSLWSSGDPTLAISGASWIRGPQWQELDGFLAVAALKSKQLLLFSFSDDLKFVEKRSILKDNGRLRSVIQGPDGDLFVTTDNDEDDKIIRLSPK